jgi:coenzyme F420 hydrogenase subunit beta
MGVEIQDGQASLIDMVIDRGICVRCGACVGLCPYFRYFNGKVVVMERCNADSSRCLQVCPRAGYEGTSPEKDKTGSGDRSEIGAYQEIIMARASDEQIRKTAQYGGVVSALLIYAIQKGEIKSAVLTDTGDPLSPAGKNTENRTEVLSCGGSRYTGAGGLSVLNSAISAGEANLGVVGLPCQMEALARMRLMAPDGEERSSKVVLRIGLFCTWAVDYRSLRAFLAKEGVEGSIKKFDIPPPPAEVFKVQSQEGWREFPLSSIRPLVQQGCAFCQDMTAELADISIGAVEGNEGWNTVVLRTQSGSELVHEAIEKGWLETDSLPHENFEHLKQASLNKRERGKKTSADMARSNA